MGGRGTKEESELASVTAKMSKRQLKLLSFFKPDPKQAKVVSADPQVGDSTAAISQRIVSDANSSTDEAAVTGAPAAGRHDDQHGEREEEDDEDNIESEKEDGGDEEDTTVTIGEGETQTAGGIWTEAQFKAKKGFFPWLTMDKTGLGCEICKKVGSLGAEKTSGMKLAKEWVSGSVTSSAADLIKQKRALRKKVFEHGKTKAHISASSILEKAKEDTLPNTVINNQSEHVQTTARIFRTAYKEAKRHRPAYGFEHEIDCQELNGVEMGRILHSNVACSHIQQHISSEMTRKMLDKIVECAPKIGLILDEATSLNKKSALIVYLRLQLPEMESPENLFLDLVELDDLSAEGIVHKLLACLEGAKLNKAFLSKTLIGLTCDGASVMLGRKSGVAARLQTLFPNIMVWHCSAHRLELAVGDVMKEMGAINHFKILMDKL